MKNIYKYIALFVCIMTMSGIMSCQRTLPEEMTELVLSNCLTPTELRATIENDFDVEFSWVATKDADSYNLVIASDAECTEVISVLTVPAADVPYMVTLEPGVYYYKVQATAEDRGASNWTYCTKAITIKAPIVAVDISTAGTSNCYLISQEGKYKFKATRGCSDVEVEGISSVALLWETSSASAGEALAVNSVIDQVSVDADGYIGFMTASPLKAGNALVAAKDEGGKILWSWHIWITSDEVKTVDMGGGLVLMDRNIGELTGTPSTSMLYQWGRKDPFPGTDGKGKLVSVAGATVSHEAVQKDYRYSVENPTVLYGALSTTSAGAQPYGLKDGDTDYWGGLDGKKSEYDPCPSGYKVPQAWEQSFNENNIAKTRFAALSSLTFADGAFSMTTGGGSLKFSPTGYYLINTDTGNYASVGSTVQIDGNSCYLWTASRVNKRLAGSISISEASGAGFWAKTGDTSAKYQGKNNAYAVRCEKMSDE